MTANDAYNDALELARYFAIDTRRLEAGTKQLRLLTVTLATSN